MLFIERLEYVETLVSFEYRIASLTVVQMVKASVTDQLIAERKPWMEELFF